MLWLDCTWCVDELEVVGPLVPLVLVFVVARSREFTAVFKTLKSLISAERNFLLALASLNTCVVFDVRAGSDICRR